MANPGTQDNERATAALIDRLSRDAAPVRRLPGPAARAALWLLVSLPFVAGVIVAHGTLPGLDRMMDEPRFLLEQFGAAITAVLAAVGAFASTVPGAGRRWLWLPLIPLAVWLASVGGGCLEDWLALGEEGLRLRIDWDCFLPMALLGTLPGAAIVLMLQRGAPLRPRLTLALGGLAVAALANVALQMFHLGDLSLMVLVWHLGSMVAFSLLASLLGPLLLRWRTPALAKPAIPGLLS